MVRRIAQYSGAFLTTLEGSIYPSHNGSSINIRITLDKLVRFLLSIWYGICLYWLFSIAYVGLTRAASMDKILLPSGLLLFTYLLSIFGFYVELSKYEMFLHSSLDKDYR
jgi:hypothetical protein